MKRKIFVLDAFTHGSDAAVKFMRRQGWKRRDCEVVFCGSHSALLSRLSETKAFGVVPVHNSTKGEVKSVTSEVKKFGRRGYRFEEIDQMRMRINHCLLSPSHVSDPRTLTRVISKQEAMDQCDGYLNGIGITPEKRSEKESTGAAAKALSKAGLGNMIGAIAPKSAAKEYGLRVLAEKIQDNQRNATTFVLLENRMEVKPVIIGIVGHGGFGKMLDSFACSIGCQVIWSDPKDEGGLSNAEVVKQADVVIFSLKLRKTVKVIRSVMKYTRPDQLLMDITSVKGPAIEAMLEGKAQVVGMHPMFAPEVGFDGQTIVVCPARLKMSHWKTWVVNMLASTRTKLKWTTSSHHDRYMMGVQNSPQFGNLINVLVMAELGIRTDESLTFTSPFYRVAFALMGRMLSHDHSLYIDILLENPATLQMIRKRIELETELASMVERKDRRGLARKFKKAERHFGKSNAREGNELFQRILAVVKSLYGNNSVLLEFTEAHDHPGLLERVGKVFRRREVNLSGFNFVKLGPNRMQFTIAFKSSKFSDEVRKALEEIEGWQTPKMKVIV